MPRMTRASGLGPRRRAQLIHWECCAGLARQISSDPCDRFVGEINRPKKGRGSRSHRAGGEVSLRGVSAPAMAGSMGVMA